MFASPPLERTSWLQNAVAFGAAVRTSRLGQRWRPDRDAREAQEIILRELTWRYAATAFGRAEGIISGMRHSQFQARVAPRAYESFVPWIERMKRGEADVLWPGTCAYYAVSSGTTQGRTKYLPVTEAMLAHFRRTGLDSLCLYAKRAGNTEVFRGRHLFLGGSTSLSPLAESAPFPAWGGDLSGITARHLPGWVEKSLYEPGREIADIADWPEKLRAIVARCVSRDVRLIAGIPSWILILAETVRLHTGREVLKETWPRLECLVHGGVPIAPFARELQTALGAGVNFHEVYPASEGFIAAQDEEPEAGLRLFADAGIFYEFIPVNRFDETRLHELGVDAEPLHGVRTGVDYVLLMSTPGGLCRYVTGDVVRFVSTQTPRLIYVGRTRLQLSAFGEHVIEKEVTDAITRVCERRELALGNFHVAPLFIDGPAGVNRGRHEWWVELNGPVDSPVDPGQFALELDAELRRLNDDYDAKRAGGGLDLPSLQWVPRGTFERWLRRRGKWGGQNKTPRCRSDREIADDLAQMTATVAAPR